MNPHVFAAAIILALTVSAYGGPWMQRKATPLLARFPRAAVWLLVGSAVAWVATALALGPLLAWAFTGPDILPEAAGAVCQRCLDAANPFAASPVASSIPIVFLLILPLLGAVALAAATGIGLWRQARRTRQTAEQLRARGGFSQLLGYRVFVVEDAAPIALTLPRRHLGIVLSTGTLQLLDTEELCAVLAHESAHLDQHHHGISEFMANFARPLRWVPMVAAGQDALGHYLEIAADDAARDCAGTTALVSALLKLGEAGAAAGAEAGTRTGHGFDADADADADAATGTDLEAGTDIDAWAAGQGNRSSDVPTSAQPNHLDHALSGSLHLNGPNRIHHLVMPQGGSAGLVFALLAAVCLSVHAFLASSVYVPYLFAGLTGCAF